MQLVPYECLELGGARWLKRLLNELLEKKK